MCSGEHRGAGRTPQRGLNRSRCLRHTGRNPDHDTFRRVFTDHARVIRNE
ncbi:DUF7848 domain-containing protein [Streptomyces blattellae]